MRCLQGAWTFSGGPGDYLCIYLSPLPLTSPPVGELFFPEAHGLCSMSALSAQMSTGTQAGEPEAGNTPPPLPTLAQQESQLGGALLPGPPGEDPQPAQSYGQEARLQSPRGSGPGSTALWGQPGAVITQLAVRATPQSLRPLTVEPLLLETV